MNAGDGGKPLGGSQPASELSLETIGSPPAETAMFWRQERERWGKVIRATGAKAD